MDSPPAPAPQASAGLPPARRLGTLVVLATLLHLLLLLGVTFLPEEGSRRNQGLEVLIVPEDVPESRRNDDAVYLAQRTQQGSGNTTVRQAAQLAGSRVPAGSDAGDPGRDAQEAAPEDRLLQAEAADAPRASVNLLPTAEMQTGDPREAARTRLPEPGQPALAGDGALTLRGTAHDELYVSPDTRASALAPYLDGWRRRVERVGTLHFPRVARGSGQVSSPVIEVSIDRTGRLAAARIRRSSGDRRIDQAALDILRLATPFEPFPANLSQYRLLHFAYEWQFRDGMMSQGHLQVP
ncbi:MAG: hypothetical protein RL026_1023 [Pseudomonadota bacterium]|jgi:protein TonB